MWNGGTTAGGFLGMRHQDGKLEARLDLNVNYHLSPITNPISPNAILTSHLFYEGEAPQNRALAFLIPFTRQDRSQHYLVAAFEFEDLSANTADSILEQPTHLLAEQPPVVVETSPISGARDIPAGATEIRVRFSKPMQDGSWSWATAWENSTAPGVDTPRYVDDGRTCVSKVRLEPGRTYAWWLNSDIYHNFKDQAGRPAVPYLLIFQTKPN
jgi:hypothetical protein